MDYTQAIIEAARRHGVDPAIALAVARRESGIQQFKPDGTVKYGKAGEVGMFQVMPSTAPGVDLTDPYKNIEAGVGYLAEMYRRFGNWRTALAAYNWGPTKERNALLRGKDAPAEVRQYVSAVTGTGGGAVRPGALLASAKPVTPQQFMAGLAAAMAVSLWVLR